MKAPSVDPATAIHILFDLAAAWLVAAFCTEEPGETAISAVMVQTRCGWIIEGCALQVAAIMRKALEGLSSWAGRFGFAVRVTLAFSHKTGIASALFDEGCRLGVDCRLDGHVWAQQLSSGTTAMSCEPAATYCPTRSERAPTVPSTGAVIAV
jgi:hypothetical protein